MSGDVGIINYYQCFSTIGRSPTKMGEYWACGLPVLCKKDTGDVDYLIGKYQNSGYMIDPANPNAYLDALKNIYSKKHQAEQLRNYAINCFDLLRGVDIYKTVYKKIIDQ